MASMEGVKGASEMTRQEYEELRRDAHALKIISEQLPHCVSLPRTAHALAMIADRLDDALDSITPTILPRNNDN